MHNLFSLAGDTFKLPACSGMVNMCDIWLYAEKSCSQVLVTYRKWNSLLEMSLWPVDPYKGQWSATSVWDECYAIPEACDLCSCIRMSGKLQLGVSGRIYGWNLPVTLPEPVQRCWNYYHLVCDLTDSVCCTEQTLSCPFANNVTHQLYQLYSKTWVHFPVNNLFPSKGKKTCLLWALLAEFCSCRDVTSRKPQFPLTESSPLHLSEEGVQGDADLSTDKKEIPWIEVSK